MRRLKPEASERPQSYLEIINHSSIRNVTSTSSGNELRFIRRIISRSRNLKYMLLTTDMFQWIIFASFLFLSNGSKNKPCRHLHLFFFLFFSLITCGLSVCLTKFSTCKRNLFCRNKVDFIWRNIVKICCFFFSFDFFHL